MATELVKCTGLSRHFGEVKALDNVDLTLESGKSLAEFAAYWRAKQFTGWCVAESLENNEKRIAEVTLRYEKMLAPVTLRTGVVVEKSEEYRQYIEKLLAEELAKYQADDTSLYLQSIGEEGEWYYCRSYYPYFIRPLRIAQ